MEIIITDNRIRSAHSFEKDIVPKSRAICFDNNKIYLDTGYCLNFSSKIIVKSSSVAKLSEKTYSKKRLKDIIDAVNPNKEESYALPEQNN